MAARSRHFGVDWHCLALCSQEEGSCQLQSSTKGRALTGKGHCANSLWQLQIQARFVKERQRPKKGPRPSMEVGWVDHWTDYKNMKPWREGLRGSCGRIMSSVESHTQPYSTVHRWDILPNRPRCDEHTSPLFAPVGFGSDIQVESTPETSSFSRAKRFEDYQTQVPSHPQGWSSERL